MNRKYKVVIVDDNPLICRALEKTIDWKKRDCQVVGTAENGSDALELISMHSPHIIISDIKMPGLDGLELITRVQEEIPGVQVIMITGYQEFEYAKRAISLGVLELVLKPIDNKKMEACIDKAVSRIQENLEYENYRQIKEENAHYRSRAKVSIAALRRQLLRDLIFQRKTREDISAQELQSLGMEGRAYSLVIGRVRSSDMEEVSRLNSFIAKEMTELEDPERIIELVNRQDMVFVIFADKEKSSRSIRIHLKNLLLLIQERLRSQMGEKYRVCFSVSRVSGDIREAKCVYEQAFEELSGNFFLAKEDLLFSSGSPESVKTEVYSMVKDLDYFYQILENMPQREVDAEIDSIVQRLTENAMGDSFKIKCLLSEICITLLRHYGENVMKTDGERDVGRVLDDINHLMDVTQAKEYLRSLVAQIQKEWEESRKMTNPLAVQALDYMRSNYEKNLTLSILAEELSVNASYLSRLLKKETGSNFVDILAGIRISRAKQLLLEKGSRVTEVGSAVGYADYAYFYQVFKRMEGISPSEYKKKGKKI